jgi:hypothetical protein
VKVILLARFTGWSLEELERLTPEELDEWIEAAEDVARRR